MEAAQKQANDKPTFAEYDYSNFYYGAGDDPTEIASRLIFRPHPDMVRGAWVRGRRLEGPGFAG